MESPHVNQKKKAGRRKIKIEFIEDKSRRQITFSKRKAGLMKKAYELTTLTGTQALLLVASETGHVYTFATPKLQPFVTLPEGKNLIQSCLNAPDAPSAQALQHPMANAEQPSFAAEDDKILLTVPETYSLGGNSSAMLIAGRFVPKTAEFNRANLKELQDIAKKWSDHLQMEVVCMAGGYFPTSNTDTEKVHFDVVFGLKVLEVNVNEGPSTGISVEHLRGFLHKTTELFPEAMWREIADKPYVESNAYVPEDVWRKIGGMPDMMYKKEDITQQKNALYLFTSGPMTSGNLVFGVLSNINDSEKNDSKYPGNQKQSQVVVGISVKQVSFPEGTYSARIPIDDEAHHERIEQTKHLEGQKAYYLIAQYE